MAKVFQITDADAVRLAIAEYDRIGKEQFLSNNGYGTATKYFLKVDGKLYDSKAIFGVAYGIQFPSAGRLRYDDFSGGEATVVKTLRTLGFEVVEQSNNGTDASRGVRNPNWTRDELILVLDLYFRVSPLTTTELHPEIAALSDLLNRLPIHSDRPDADRFRNPNGVYMKMCNFLRFDPGYTGVGLKAGSHMDKAVWDEFAGDRERLRKVAQLIADAVNTDVDSIRATPNDDSVEAAEGRVLTRVHLIRERNRGLIEKKKRRVLAERGHLECEVCGFDFASVYGKLGDGFIECHHTIPISQLEPGQMTRTADLALVCSNCHRMLHKGDHWVSIDELKEVFVGRRTVAQTASLDG